MIDAFEQKHGPVEDRSIFHGEIVVPPHLRNISFTSIRANRGNLFGSVPRSRTLFSLPPNARHTFHGSVPDLSRHSSPFTFNNNNNTSNITLNIDNDGDGDDGGNSSRRLSSASTIPETITKITLNTSTTLALTNNLKKSPSNGNANHSSIGKNAHAIESIDEHRRLEYDHDDYDYKSNSIRSLNDIQLRERSGMDQDRALYCQSLGRPQNRTQKVQNNQKLRSQPQSLDAYSSEGYMTLIKTNLAPSSHGRYNQRSSLNRATSPSMNDGHETQMATSTSTFQRKTAPPPPPPPSKKSNHSNQSSSTTGGFANEISLNNFTRFKLPRVSLNHSAVTNPQQ